MNQHRASIYGRICERIRRYAGPDVNTQEQENTSKLTTRMELGEWKIDVRPLEALDIDDQLPTSEPITIDTIKRLCQSNLYQQKIRPYFTDYPARSLMGPDCRALLYCLTRMMKAREALEVGTLFGGTSEVFARALWENGGGTLYTTDPFGAERCPILISQWPAPLQTVTRFSSDSSMIFFARLQDQRLAFDIMLIDGNHNFEFALFDLQMAAKLLRPNGIVVMDNAEQSGPFHASRHFLRSNTEWREIGTAISGHDPTAPFNVERSSVSGTSFLLLQGPSFVPLYKGTPQSWGQQYVDSVQMSGFAVDLVPQDAQGTLYYQAVLRAFADNNKSVEEHRSLGSVPIKASGEIRKVQHRFPKTLRTNLPIRFTECRQSVEIEVVWEPAGNLNAPLKLKTAPTPIF